MNIENSLWTERYRPKTIADYVCTPEFKKKIEYWVQKNDVKHLLLHEPDGGTGKTTLAKLIPSLLDATVLYINASQFNGIDVVRDRIYPFAMSGTFTKWKIVILDEADGLTTEFQKSLRPIMEQYSDNTRFILTCNTVEKILQPIRSRCDEFDLSTPPPNLILERLLYILDTEGIEYNKDDVKLVIRQFYPDQRSMLNYLQDNSERDKILKLVSFDSAKTLTSDILSILKSNFSAKQKIDSVRIYLNEQKIRNFNSLYKYMYNNIEKVSDATGQNNILIICSIADAQYKDYFVVDKEINFVAFLANLIK